MSMNLYVHGLRKAFAFNRFGKKVEFEDRRNFCLWQTPTELTYKILELKTVEEKIKAYIDWIYSVSSPREEIVYDYSANPNEDFNYPVIGKEIVNPAKEHEEQLKDFVKYADDEGFELEFYTL